MSARTGFGAASHTKLAVALAAVVAIGTLLATAQAAFAQLHPNDRQGWLVGFAVGGGSLALTADGHSSDRQGGTAVFLRGGYAFNEDLSLELNGAGWTKEEDNTTVTFSTGTVALNYYPGHSGLILRAGVGGGSGEVKQTLGNLTATGTENGIGLLAGAAYEFRVLRTFALGPQVEYNFASFDKFEANWVNVGLGFTWYFPKSGRR